MPGRTVKEHHIIDNTQLYYINCRDLKRRGMWFVKNPSSGRKRVRADLGENKDKAIYS